MVKFKNFGFYIKPVLYSLRFHSGTSTMSFSKTISLPTGTLNIQINESEALFNQYIDFAARNNPKRGFLFVSKVLAKHYPCKPAVILQSYDALAQLVLDTEKQSENFVFVGMAETATALGLGIYESWLKKTAKKGIYCQTTRYFLSEQPFLEFEETHSHASDFYLYLPEKPELKQIFNTADTLVLIDDEISTGNTFANLINAYKKINPQLKRVLVLSLLNLTEEPARANVKAKTGIQVEWLSILTGSYDFSPALDFYFNPVNVDSKHECKKALLSLDYGRLGRQGLLQPLEGALAELTQDWQEHVSVLVLGTGEFIYHAFLLGLQLEKQGFDVYVQSTTRSPILTGAAIGDCLTFTDNYGDGIINFLYNSKKYPYPHILVCHETPKNAEINTLLSLLNATSIQVNDGTLCIS
jgi:hypothetical protein